LWVTPHRYLKVFGGVTLVGLSGSVTDLFEPAMPAAPIEMDYDQKYYHAGIRFNQMGRMLQASFKKSDFSDNMNPDRDQSRYYVKFDGLLPVPIEEDQLFLSAGFRHFETEFDNTGFKISSNTFWSGALLKLQQNSSIKYNVYFDRAASDSDFVATDNLAHAIYLSRWWPLRAGITFGYQYDVNDDDKDEVQANSVYLSGWLKPLDRLEFRGELGMRAEDVKEGSRLIGDEDRSRFKLSVKYSDKMIGALKVLLEQRMRENDEIGSEADFTRYSIGGDAAIRHYCDISAGYAYSLGDYQNVEQSFESRDHYLYVDITSREYYRMTAGFGVTYYRSKRDLDVESFALRFVASYRFQTKYRFEAAFSTDSFDDFLVRDQYYTANIVELSIIRDFSI
jgi:hypothetical protein